VKVYFTMHRLYFCFISVVIAGYLCAYKTYKNLIVLNKRNILYNSIYSDINSNYNNETLITKSTINNNQVKGKGQVYVCTNKWCREKGSDATMAAFTFLTPEATPVVGVNCLGRCNKGPNVRIFTPEGAFVEASMVRSVEVVVELLQTHLLLQVNVTSAEVLKLNCNI